MSLQAGEYQEDHRCGYLPDEIGSRYCCKYRDLFPSTKMNLDPTQEELIPYMHYCRKSEAGPTDGNIKMMY